MELLKKNLEVNRKNMVKKYKLDQDYVTRWNSTFNMVKSIKKSYKT